MTTILKFFLFCSFYFQQIENVPSPSRYQIDEFISQLMTSEKFSELADVIAEKAARKLKTVEFSNVSPLRHSYQSDRAINTKPYKDKRLHARVDSVLKGETKVDEENSGKFGKINTKAFLKHDASSQELYLNYKHIIRDQKDRNAKLFSSKKYKHRDSGSDNIFSDHSKEQSKLMSKENPVNVGSKERNIKTKSRIDKESKDKKHSIISDDDSSDDIDEDSINNKTSINSMRKTHNIKSSQEDSHDDRTLEVVKKDNRNSDRTYKNKTTFETTKTNINDASADTSNFENRMGIHTYLNTNESQQHKSPVILSNSKEVKVGLNRALTDDSSEEKNLNMVKEKHKTKKPIEAKQIRRENGKLYTFISSPDYDEYHENVAKLSRNNYINTYK